MGRIYAAAFALLMLALGGHSRLYAQHSDAALPQIRFEQGLQLLLSKEYAEATQLFSQLHAETGSQRVLLEWARSAYLQQDYDKANELFKVVLANSPPLPVREKIIFFLDDIALAQGRVDYAFSLLRDTNPGVVPSGRALNIFGMPFEYKPPFDTRPRWGTNYKLSATSGLDTARRWIASAGILGTHYGMPELNKTGLDAHLTYRWEIEPRVEFKMSHESMDRNSEKLYRYKWLTMHHSTDMLADWRWNNELRYGAIDYPAYPYQNSLLSSYRLAGEKTISSFASLGFEFGLEKGRAVEPAYSFVGSSHGLTGTYFMPTLLTRFQLKWLLSNRQHAEMDPLFGIRRKDRRQSITLAMEPSSIRIAGLTPVLELGYEENNSTLALSNYHRLLASLNFKRSYWAL